MVGFDLQRRDKVGNVGESTRLNLAKGDTLAI